MAFSFGFTDDLDDEDMADVATAPPQIAAPVEPAHEETVPVKTHRLEDLLTSLPERISYSTVKVESPLGKVAYIPRRELFDVRIQLIAEDAGNDHVIDQLSNSDLRAGVYEGGFKTWESSLDLARLLLDRGPRKDLDELCRCDQVIELGAGTALPSMILWRHCVSTELTGLGFTFADYNEEVLRLVTLPNLILTYAATISSSASTDADEDLISLRDITETSQGELELTPALLSSFRQHITAHSLNINFLSGPWCAELAAQIPSSAPEMGTLILAAETIYSPASTAAFVDLLAVLLRRVKMAKAMIGAKRMYFGVGGSVDGLKEACRERGAVAYEVENHGVSGMEIGVGRALIEVQMY